MNTPVSPVEAVAKALFELAIKTAREKIEKTDFGLGDAEEFFLGLQKESDAGLVILATSYIDAHLTDAWKRSTRPENLPSGDPMFGSGAKFDVGQPVSAVRGQYRRGGTPMAHIDELTRAVSETGTWVDDMAKRLTWHDRDKAYGALVATLHALRDSLPWDDAVRLGAHFPILLRGLFYEGWHPTSHSLPQKTREEFFERIHASLHHDPGVDPELLARALLALLASRVPEADLEEITMATPKQLHGLWPQ